MEIVERFIRGKASDPALCEDAIVVTDHYAAVIDGATDVSGRSYGGAVDERPGGGLAGGAGGGGRAGGAGGGDEHGRHSARGGSADGGSAGGGSAGGGSAGGVTGGRWAMAACRAAVEGLAAGADAYEAVAALTRELAGRVDLDLAAAERPSASVTVYSAARREVWQVGDVGFWHSGLAAGVGQPRKLVDRVAVAMRVAVIAAEVAAGRLDLDTSGPDRSDPGRAAARELISRQGALRNTSGSHGYAGIDGCVVPRSLVVVHPVPGGVTELVIASDGYPVIGGTLAESETVLADLLARDPWCVAELAGTKGLLPGQVSFDDRAYLRLRLG